MRKTPNYNMNLPDGTDYYNIEQFNENATITDTTMHNLQASIAANASEIQTMKQTFQAGVEACYDACVTKGSTPASYALSDVVQGILDIETGGGDFTFMYPQEVADLYMQLGGCGFIDWIDFENNKDIVVGHFITSSDNSIEYNIKGTAEFYEKHSDSFSIVIDNTTVIPVTTTYAPSSIPTNDPGYDEYFCDFNISFALSNSLTPGYHTLALRCTNVGGTMYHFQNIIYGNNFTPAIAGGYLVNGNLIQFIPDNFIIPTNPTVYDLGGTYNAEDICDVMNNHFSSSFDTGISYQMQWITPYEEDGETVEIEDTFVYTNGKFIYSHHGDRAYSDTVYEDHYFILPVNGDLFKYCPYINIQCKVDDTYSSQGNLIIKVLERVDEDELSYSSGSLNPYPQDLSYLEYDNFIVSLETGLISNSNINFIAICFTDVPTDVSDFTIEINKIWGSNRFLGNNDDY